MIEYDNGFEISSDGATVWVNDVICVGRFCHSGIDFDDSLRVQLGEMAYPEGGTTLREWRLFQRLLAEHYQVVVSDRHMPTFLQPECVDAAIANWP